MMSSSSGELHQLSVVELAKALAERKVSAVEASQAFLGRMKAHEALGTFLDVNEEATLAQARAADALIAKGDAPALAGVPIAHKDIFVTTDFATTAGSKMLAGYRSPFDATVVRRLADAGAVTLGKLSCDEFAMGSANENVAVPAVGHDKAVPVRNPWNTERIPGGSSGASAAAVAARLAPAATGTDTGGSIRQPASFCGITGIKPTYGRASRYGMIAFASSLDQAGPMAQTAEDCALLLGAMTGFDERDSTSLSVEQGNVAEDYTRDLDQPLAGLRIGVPKEYFGEGLAADVEKAVRAALAKFVELGATLVDVSLPNTALSIPAYYMVAPAEASSNLSRFDGVRYGFRAEGYKDLQDMYKKTRAQAFGPEVQRRIMVGTYILCHGYYDAYYLKAQKIRRKITDDFAKVLGQQCDVIMGPVAPTVAWDLGSKADDPVANYLADIFTLSTSLAGLPGMSIPVGFGEGEKNASRPVGLQIIGNYFAEAKLLNIAHQFQQNTDWHKRAPTGI